MGDNLPLVVKKPYPKTIVTRADVESDQADNNKDGATAVITEDAQNFYLTTTWPPIGNPAAAPAVASPAAPKPVAAPPPDPAPAGAPAAAPAHASAPAPAPHAPGPVVVPHAPAGATGTGATDSDSGHASGKFPQDIIAAAQASNLSCRIPASVTLAQWALESGWGQHMPPGSNNPFGIKARTGEPSVEASTREVVHGQNATMAQPFRKFASIGEAFEAHGRLLADSQYYAKARACLPDANAFADALTGVYATDPNYGTKLKNMMTRYDLHQYNSA